MEITKIIMQGLKLITILLISLIAADYSFATPVFGRLGSSKGKGLKDSESAVLTSQPAWATQVPVTEDSDSTTDDQIFEIDDVNQESVQDAKETEEEKSTNFFENVEIPHSLMGVSMEDLERPERGTSLPSESFDSEEFASPVKEVPLGRSVPINIINPSYTSSMKAKQIMHSNMDNCAEHIKRKKHGGVFSAPADRRVYEIQAGSSMDDRNMDSLRKHMEHSYRHCVYKMNGGKFCRTRIGGDKIANSFFCGNDVDKDDEPSTSRSFLEPYSEEEQESP